jgi:integrase/recombinase XerD
MAETGLRASEVVDLQVSDVDLTRGMLLVTKGKGSKGRYAPFSPQVATALDRYVRMRRQHADPNETQLFIGGHIKTFTYWALAQTLRRRAKEAGIEGFHVHLLRHIAATRWLPGGWLGGGLPGTQRPGRIVSPAVRPADEYGGPARTPAPRPRMSQQ